MLSQVTEINNISLQISLEGLQGFHILTSWNTLLINDYSRKCFYSIIALKSQMANLQEAKMVLLYSCDKWNCQMFQQKQYLKKSNFKRLTVN